MQNSATSTVNQTIGASRHTVTPTSDKRHDCFGSDTLEHFHEEIILIVILV